MLLPGSFDHWFPRVRAADPDATTALVREYGPVLRRVVQARLAARRLGRLGRLVDPLDICQTAFAEFFAQLASERVAVDSERHLRALLVSIARNKIRDEVRRHKAARRDFRRLIRARPDDDLHWLAGTDPSPSTVVAGAELYEAVTDRLSPTERKLFEDRAGGREWVDIAAEHGVSPQVVRKQLNRAMHRVHRQLVAAGLLSEPPAPDYRPDEPDHPARTDDSSPPNSSRTPPASSAESGE